MSRKARLKDDYGTFYINQISGGSRHLFECDLDRERFLSILARTQRKYQFKLYAYCFLSNDEIHLVINVNGGDLSKIMKSMNIAYAMYTKCDGQLFKDRYKSTLLNSDIEIINVVSSIHKRYIDQSIWNSYCTFDGLSPLNLDLIDTSVNSCIDCIHTIQEAKEMLQKIAIKDSKTVSELISNKNDRNLLIQDFRKHSTLSLKDLGQVFGGLSESSVCKILNQ